MSTGVNRRDFMRTAGTTAGVMIATGWSPFSYAQNEKVRVGCIGTGGQGSLHLRGGLTAAEAIDVVAVCDVYAPHQKQGALLARLANAGISLGPGQPFTDALKQKAMAALKPQRFYNYKEMLEMPDLDAVVIASPLATHYQIAVDALDAGKWVFCEKTMCFTIEEARNLVIKSHQTGKFVQVGHQRRYNPMYNKGIMMGREEGVVGRITHIDAQWHRNDDWRRPVNPNYKLNSMEQQYISDIEQHMNWRLYRDHSGGLMTELATHQLDVASWMLDAMPKRCVGYGGLDYWRDGRTVCDNVNVMYEFEITPENRGYRAINRRNKYQDPNKINEPYTVRFIYSSINANGKRGSSESIQGDEGTLVLTEMGSMFYPEATASVAWAGSSSASEEAEKNASIVTSGGTRELSNEAQDTGEPITVENDKGVDQLQFEAFARDIQTGGMPRANVMCGLRAAIMALTGMEAIRDHKEVEIDPALYTFDFPTPNPTAIG